jgi:hypothetical protein
MVSADCSAQQFSLMVCTDPSYLLERESFDRRGPITLLDILGKSAGRDGKIYTPNSMRRICMPQKLFFAAAFAHRHNSDGTWDSICPKCFFTIATEGTEEELLTYEARHDCVALMKSRMRAGIRMPIRGEEPTIENA